MVGHLTESDILLQDVIDKVLCCDMIRFYLVSSSWQEAFPSEIPIWKLLAIFLVLERGRRENWNQDFSKPVCDNSEGTA